MMDVVMVALGVGFFALSIAYVYACEQLWGDRIMIFDYSLAALVTAGLLIYLVYALIKPELFW